MKKLINQCRKPFLLASVITILLFGVFTSTFAQKGVGAKYGSRDPHACADRSQPKTGAISAEKAKEYVLCSEHIIAINLYLVEEVNIQQVGKARPYNPNEDENLPNIDATKPVSPIRGSYRNYQCAELSDILENAGKNCLVYDHPNAKGICYKDSFGDWKCTLSDNNFQLVAKGAAPPGATKQANPPANKKNEQNNQPKNDEQKGENKPNAADKDENGNPKPDMSDMDKWYEITKIEAGDPATNRETKFLFKPKIEHYARSRARFEARYYDKDGALVGSYQVWVEYSTEVGEVGKGSFGTPSEKEMERVASVKIVRLKE